jgi:two-component system, OmpR family, response regulator CpxR
MDLPMPELQKKKPMAPTTRLLMVDDDTELCSSLSRLLKMDGFEVTAVHDGDAGVRESLSGKYDAVILDVMLPGSDGKKVLRQIRMKSEIPVLMLTARGDDADRIAGLEGGADDYLPKPFNARELVARLRAILRRRGEAAPEVVEAGDVQIHLKTRRVLQNQEEVVLTSAEFDILLLLARNAGKPLTRDEIAETALGRPVAPLDRSIDNHVSNLRRKLGSHVGELERIRNIRGMGYCYTGDPG